MELLNSENLHAIYLYVLLWGEENCFVAVCMFVCVFVWLELGFHLGSCRTSSPCTACSLRPLWCVGRTGSGEIRMVSEGGGVVVMMEGWGNRYGK